MITLREFDEQIIPTVTPYIVEAYGAGNFLFESMSELNKYLPKFVLKEPSFNRDYYMLVEADKSPVGFVCLHNIDWKNRNLVADVHTEPKYMADAIAVLTEFAFTQLDMRKVSIYLSKSDEEKVSSSGNSVMVKEGSLRNHAFKGGRFENVSIFSAIRS